MRLTVFKNSHGRCFYCGEALSFDNFTIDHVIPRSSKSAWNYAGYEQEFIRSSFNLLVSCDTCNKARGTKPVLEFLQEIGWDMQVFLELMDKPIKCRLVKDVERRCDPSPNNQIQSRTSQTGSRGYSEDSAQTQGGA